MDADVVIVGAGVVGLAVAVAVARADRTVFVLERATTFGTGTSSRNSEVVHSGIYYPPGSLKARLCVEGNRRLRALAEEGRFAFLACGKLVVAVEPAEIPTLEGLLAVGRANGVEGLELIGAADVPRFEPHVRAVAALVVPSTGVVDSHGLLRDLVGRARDGGALMVYGCRVDAAEPMAGGYRLHVGYLAGGGDTLTARLVVNAAGLDADLVAALPGLDVDAAGYRQEWVKGNYAEVGNGKQRLISRPIYPAPVYHGVRAGAGQAAFSGLGVHATRGVDGRVRLGPDVEYLSGRSEQYGVRRGTAESFYESARRFLPFLEPDDVTPESAGIRPRLAAAREAFADFVIAEESARGLPGWINLVGIESPGLTCALPIADEVARLVGELD
ncbi:MAG: dehydrogenase [Dehalococcoidia bacterium]|nr:MAG: dehydrogenase [Dehalococcoidia bacterium]